MELVPITLKKNNMNKQEKKNLGNSTKRKRIIAGSIVEIPMDKEFYVYAQILNHGSYAFFDYRSEKPLCDLSELLDKPVLFILGVYDYIIKNNIWSIVGKLPIREDLQKQPLMYIYDVHTDKYCLYDNNTGEITSCTKDQARGLERASVWEENQIEDRIRDYYNNLPCIWLSEHYQLFPESKPIRPAVP
jgi:hypothetical protein